jgi:hypothetical protein
VTTDDLKLDAAADDQRLLGQTVAYYHQSLKAAPNALGYLQRRGISNGQAVDHFRIGYADRSLGRTLPSRDSHAGVAIRTRLQQLGLLRDTGHEHLAGSITFPLLAADGCGQIVDIYGRKLLGGRLRRGTPIHTHLNGLRRGVLNVEAFGAADDIVLCGSLWDALTFWCHGYRNATCMFGSDALTEDLLAAFAEFRVERVLTPCEAITDRLLRAGLEVFLLRLPLGLDVNAYARQVKDPADALGSLLRAAEWVGRGQRGAAGMPAFVDEFDAEDDDEEDALAEFLAAEEEEEDLDDEPLQDEEPPPVRTASPVPAASQEIEVEVSEDEVVVCFGSRRYRVRGLSRNTAWDMLRVNVLVSNDSGLFVDTFDLYSARHRQAFQRQAAEEIGVEEQTVKRDLGRLLLKLEELQDEQRRTTLQPKETTPAMPPEERAAALRLLRDPDLLERIVSDFDVVGERTNKLVGYLAVVSRKLDQPLAVVLQSSNAAGKSALMDAILSLVPPEDVVKFSALTGQSLYYLADDRLQHKVLALVEEEGARRAGYALKLLQSEGELRLASTGKEASTGRLVTQEYRVAGPVTLMLTTCSLDVDEELLNRCLVLTVDEDRDQTRLIHQSQRQRQTLAGQLAAQAHAETLKLHRNAQRLLRPLLVANPYAERLTFADDRTRTRRDHQKYLTLIRAITLLHQYQRPIRTVQHQGQTVEYIEVTLEDIALANELATEALGRSLDDVPPQTRRLLDLLDGMVSRACERDGLDRGDYRFGRRQVREFTGWGDTQLKVHLKRLEEQEYLLVHRERGRRRHVYELLSQQPGASGGRVLPGLIDVEVLRQCERSGSKGDRSGYGRGAVGPRSG